MFPEPRNQQKLGMMNLPVDSAGRTQRIHVGILFSFSNPKHWTTWTACINCSMFCQTIEIEWHRCKYIHQFSDNGLYLNLFNKTQSNYIFKHMINWQIFSEVSTFHSHNMLLLGFSIMKMWQRQMWPRPFLRNAPCCSLTGWWGPCRLTSVQVWIHPCCPDLSENTSGCLGLCKGLIITFFSIGPIIIHYGKTVVEQTK